MTKHEQRVEAGLAAGDTIEIVVDSLCKGAMVSVGSEMVMLGNFWDFHPGCHGLNAWGDWWTSCGSLASALQERSKELRKGETPSQIVRRYGSVFE